jgi:hypothetical protein
MSSSPKNADKEWYLPNPTNRNCSEFSIFVACIRARIDLMIHLQFQTIKKDIFTQNTKFM